MQAQATIDRFNAQMVEHGIPLKFEDLDHIAKLEKLLFNNGEEIKEEDETLKILKENTAAAIEARFNTYTKGTPEWNELSNETKRTARLRLELKDDDKYQAQLTKCQSLWEENNNFRTAHGHLSRKHDIIIKLAGGQNQ